MSMLAEWGELMAKSDLEIAQDLVRRADLLIARLADDEDRAVLLADDCPDLEQWIADSRPAVLAACERLDDSVGAESLRPQWDTPEWRREVGRGARRAGCLYLLVFAAYSLWRLL